MAEAARTGALRVWMWPSGGCGDGHCRAWRGGGTAAGSHHQEGQAPRAALWDAAARSIVACCTHHTTQNISDSPRSLTTSPEGLHGLEIWQYSALGMAKRSRWELNPTPCSPQVPEVSRPSKLRPFCPPSKV